MDRAIMTSGNGRDKLARFSRQIVFRNFGLAGQEALSAGSAVIVGVGGLGTWVAELLARAGVGRLRLIDSDKVDLTNIHRQGLYDEANAESGKEKVHAAAERLHRVNGQVRIEPIASRADKDNIEQLIDGMDVILDGTDNFHTRYLMNDVSVKTGLPWVFAGVIGCEAQMMTIIPGRTPCLRCVLETAGPPCTDEDCRSFGVLGPAVAAAAAFEACEAMKILAGRSDRISRRLVKFDLWANTVQRIDLTKVGGSPGCICCGQREFEYLHPQGN